MKSPIKKTAKVIPRPARASPTFGTVFVGSGLDPLPFQRRREKKNKKITPAKRAVIDPFYAIPKERAASNSLLNQRIHGIIEQFKRQEIIVFSKDVVEAFDQMARDKITVGRFRLNFPYPYQYEGVHRMPSDHYLRQFVDGARKVLVPNGKVYIRSENEPMLEEIRGMAARQGWKVSAIHTYSNQAPPGKPSNHKTPLEYHQSNLIQGLLATMPRAELEKVFVVHELILTNGLKQAIPTKSERREWKPNQQAVRKRKSSA